MIAPGEDALPPPTAPEPVFLGDRLRAHLFRPEEDAEGRPLLVTFRHRLAKPGAFDPPRPVARFLAAGWSHLHIQTRLNDWYVNPETVGLERALAVVAEGFGQRFAIGYSMGGYGALRLSRPMALNLVAAVSPQFSIHPAAVPFDGRYAAEAAGFDLDAGDLARHALPGVRGVVIFDPARWRDRMNAQMIAEAMPGVHLCRFGFGGHPASQVLRETCGSASLQLLALEGRLDRPAVLALHRANRRGSVAYWKARLTACQERGKPRAVRAARAALRALRAARGEAD